MHFPVIAVGLWLGMGVAVWAQGPFALKGSPFPVRKASGVPLNAPFTGGYYTPRAQLADIDGDGDADLFLHETEGGIAFHFLETVQSGAGPVLKWHGREWMGLETRRWARLGDVDGDGDLDILCESRLGVRIYRNTGTATAPAFEVATDALRAADGEALQVPGGTPLDLFDVDCDGKKDLVVSTGPDLVVRKHMGLDDKGLPVFGQGTILPIQRAAAKGAAGAAVQHPAASYFAFTDLNGDGIPDLLWGSIDDTRLERVENRGTCAEPVMVATGKGYPPALPIAGAGPVLVQAADFEGDGDDDLFNVIAEDDFDSTLGEPFAEVELYRNMGPAGAPAYRLETRTLMVTLDLGQYAFPALADLDGDGDLDMMIFAQAHPGLERNRVAFFRNEGQPQAPDFREDASIALPPGESGYPAPAFADLDGDGDLDLLLGGLYEGLHLYRNQGNAASPDFRLGDTLFAGHEGTTPAPAFADIDGDGDVDLFVGEWTSSAGKLVFYRNHGDAAQPDFRSEPFPLDALPDGYPTLAFADLDGDDDLDLAVGTASGRLHFYQNTGNAANPAFRHGGVMSVEPTFRPVLADLDGDGDADLLGGGARGGVLYLENPGAGVNIWQAFRDAGLAIRPRHRAVTPGVARPDGRLFLFPGPGRLPAGLEIRNLLGRRIMPSLRSGASAVGRPAGASYAPAGAYWAAPAGDPKSARSRAILN